MARGACSDARYLLGLRGQLLSPCLAHRRISVRFLTPNSALKRRNPPTRKDQGIFVFSPLKMQHYICIPQEGGIGS